MAVDAGAHKKAGFYKRQILILQENFKLFAVILGAYTLVMLPLNIANACTGGVALWLSVLLNVIWIGGIGAFIAYVLVGSRKKRAYFARIGELAYGALGGRFTSCTVAEAPAPLQAGERVRLYEDEDRYILVCDGLDRCGMEFWSKYNFKRDFGAVYLEKTGVAVREQADEVGFVGENIFIRLKREELV